MLSTFYYVIRDAGLRKLPTKHRLCSVSESCPYTSQKQARGFPTAGSRSCCGRLFDNGARYADRAVIRPEAVNSFAVHKICIYIVGCKEYSSINV